MRIKTWTKYDLPLFLSASVTIMVAGVITRNLWLTGGGLAVFLICLLADDEKGDVKNG
jgi:hypothetical protein